MLLFEHPATAKRVDCAPLRRCHQPRGRLFRNAFFRPSLKGRNQSVPSELLRNADVAGNARNPGDEPRGLDLPHGLNRFVNGCFVHVRFFEFRSCLNVAHALRAVAFLSSAKLSVAFCTSFCAAAEKSPISNIWRTSMISLSAIGARVARSIAPSREGT